MGVGIFKDRKARTFLYETLLKKRGKFESCKKAEARPEQTKAAKARLDTHRKKRRERYKTDSRS